MKQTPIQEAVEEIEKMPIHDVDKSHVLYALYSRLPKEKQMVIDAVKHFAPNNVDSELSAEQYFKDTYNETN